MKIHKCKDNGYGWRIKFKYRKTDDCVFIVQQHLIKWSWVDTERQIWLTTQDQEDFHQFQLKMRKGDK